MSQYESSPPPPAGLPERVLDATGLACAVVEGPDRRLIWWNQGFGARAAHARLKPSELARDILVGATAGVVRPLLGGAAPPAVPQWLLRLDERPPSVTPPALDSLTGVLSRPALEATLREWFRQRDRRPFTLAFIDLVDFKSVNDRFGHPAGDQCLAEVGRRLGRALRAGDLVGRYGGDEFVLLLAGRTPSPGADSIRLRVQQEVGLPLEIRGQELRLSLSWGVASSEAACSPAELIAAADAAMYADKRRASASPRVEETRGDVAEGPLLG